MLFCSHTLKAYEKQNKRNWAKCNSEFPKGRERERGPGGGRERERAKGGGGERERAREGERERGGFVACLVAIVSERFFMHTVSVADPNILVLCVSLCIRIGSYCSFFFFFLSFVCLLVVFWVGLFLMRERVGGGGGED